MAYDFKAALAAGYSTSEIASDLEANPVPGATDVTAARKAGYSDDEIVHGMMGQQPTPARNILKSIVPGSIQRGFAHTVEGVANTADIVGATGAGGSLHGAVDQEALNAPTSNAAVSKAWHDGNYGQVLSNLPGAVGEAIPQLAGQVASAAGGAAIGSAVGPGGTVAGFAAGAAGDALFGVVTQAGDIAKARAKADGRTEPNAEDIAIAVGSSGVLGALDRIGLGKMAGGVLASAVKNTLGRGAAGRVATGIGSGVIHGATDAVQSVGQQAAQTVDTAQGLTINPDEIATQALVGAGTRGALGGARYSRDLATGELAAQSRARASEVNAEAYRQMDPENQAGVQNVASASRVLEAAKNVETENPQKPNANVAARTGKESYANDIGRLIDTWTNGDSAIFTADQGKAARGLLSEAKNSQRSQDPEAVRAAIAELPLSGDSKKSLADALSQVDMLSTAGVKDSNKSKLGAVLAFAGGAAGVMTPGHPFMGAQAGSMLGRFGGDWISRKLGFSNPALVTEGAKAVAMLDAAGVTVPDTRAGLVDAIGQSHDTMKVMAAALGLNPENYGFTSAEQRAMTRDATKAETAKTAQTEASYKQDAATERTTAKVDDAKSQAFDMADQARQASVESGYKSMEADQRISAQSDKLDQLRNMATTRSQVSGYLADQAAIQKDGVVRSQQSEQSSKDGDRQDARGQAEMAKVTAAGENAGVRMDRITDRMSPAEVVAIQRSSRAGNKAPPEAPIEGQATPTAGKGPQASKGVPEAPTSLSDPAPEMLNMTPEAAMIASHLPKWQWVMGQKVQQQLAMSGNAKNVNYAKESMAVVDQMHDAGIIDGPMRDGLKSFDGVMPRGFFNLIRQRWLMNHGIDRRTSEAQGSDESAGLSIAAE